LIKKKAINIDFLIYKNINKGAKDSDFLRILEYLSLFYTSISKNYFVFEIYKKGTTILVAPLRYYIRVM